ncbi:hypothetical protein ACWKSP_02075 [Micromonosporaceae bacterium Da 78-11]
MTAPPTTSAPAETPAAAAGPERSRRRPGHVVVALVFVALGGLVMAHYLGDPDGRVSGHLANDNTWFAWLLSHGEYSVRHLANPLFSVRQNYPTGVNMMANTSVLGVTLPLAPLTMLAGPWVSYLVWSVGACAGTAFATYWVLQRYVVRSRVAAFLGGALAGFAPGAIHHANGQPNFVSNFVLPFIVVRALRLGVDRRPVRDGLVLGLLVTYQVFLNEELLLIAATGCGVAVLAYAVMRPREAWQRARPFALALVVAAALAGALCAYPLWFQFNGPGTFKSLPLYQTWGEDPFSYLAFARDTVFGDAAVERKLARSEQNSWFGWPLTALVVLSIVLLWRRHLAVRVAAVVALVCGAAALGPHLRLNGVQTTVPGPWHFIPDDLPVLGLLTPSRITFAVIGAFVLIVAVAWDSLGPLRARRSTPGRLATGLGMVLIVAALVPLIPTPLPVVDKPRPPEFITSGTWRTYVPAGSSLVPVPLPGKAKYGLDSLGWGVAELDFDMPEGYFLAPGPDGFGYPGAAPPSTLTVLVSRTYWAGRTATVNPQLRADVLADLRRWHGSVVVVRARPQDETYRVLVEKLLGPPQRNLDVWVWPIPR